MFPHHNVEAAAGLVAENKASIVVIPLSVDEEGTTEVHGIKLIITWKAGPGSVKDCGFYGVLYNVPGYPAWSKATGVVVRFYIFSLSVYPHLDLRSSLLTYSKSRVTVYSLDEFFALMADNPVRVILGGSFGI